MSAMIKRVAKSALIGVRIIAILFGIGALVTLISAGQEALLQYLGHNWLFAVLALILISTVHFVASLLLVPD